MGDDRGPVLIVIFIVASVFIMAIATTIAIVLWLK